VVVGGGGGGCDLTHRFAGLEAWFCRGRFVAGRVLHFERWFEHQPCGPAVCLRCDWKHRIARSHDLRKRGVQGSVIRGK
jgi:hypothetical protein